MNPKVQTYLDDARQKVKESELSQRNKHLISLGLIDEEKSTRIYFDSWVDGGLYDHDKNQYYKGEIVAIKVTDEEYAEICKYTNTIESNINVQEEITDSAEKTLSTLSTIVLVGGITLSIIIFLGGLITSGSSLFILILYILPTSIISWGLLKVISNISRTLNQINRKMK